jgi:hypothetical protein
MKAHALAPGDIAWMMLGTWAAVRSSASPVSARCSWPRPAEPSPRPPGPRRVPAPYGEHNAAQAHSHQLVPDVGHVSARYGELTSPSTSAPVRTKLAQLGSYSPLTFGFVVRVAGLERAISSSRTEITC